MKVLFFLVLLISTNLVHAEVQTTYVTNTESDKNFELSSVVISAASSVFQSSATAACPVLNSALEKLKNKASDLVLLIDDLTSSIFMANELLEVDEKKSAALVKDDILTKSEVEESGPYFMINAEKFSKRLLKLYESGCL